MGTRGRKQPDEAVAERRAREAEALRANLLKRKAQQRQRQDRQPADDAECSTDSDTKEG